MAEHSHPDWWEAEKARIRVHEGEVRNSHGRHVLYPDSRGIETIGWGFNIEGGISDAAADFLLEEKMAECAAELDGHIPWWRDKPIQVQRVLLNMCYNMGWKPAPERGMHTLVSFILAIHDDRYSQAADWLWNPTLPREKQRYKYSRQVGEHRAGDLANVLRAVAASDG